MSDNAKDKQTKEREATPSGGLEKADLEDVQGGRLYYNGIDIESAQKRDRTGHVTPPAVVK